MQQSTSPQTRENANNTAAYVRDLTTGKIAPGEWIIYANGALQFSGKDREEAKAIASGFPNETLVGQVSFRAKSMHAYGEIVRFPSASQEPTHPNYFP